MKKIISLSLTLLLIFICSIPAFATSSISNNVHVLSTSSMSEANQFAIGTYQDFLDSHCYFNGTSDNLHARLGSGFKVENMSSLNSNQYYLYPIFVDDSIKYIYRVYKSDNEFYGVLSELLANEIDSIFKTSSGDIVFLESNDNLAIVSNSSYKIIRESPDNKEILYSDILKAKSSFFIEPTGKSVSNVNKINPYTTLYSHNSVSVSSSQETRSSKVLPIDYLEDQGTEPWCAGYVTANILRYMTKDSSIRVTDIASYGLVSIYEGFALTTLQQFSASKGITMSNYINGEIAPTTLYNSYLLQDRPIYLGLQSTKSDTRHAVVLHGVNGNYYYIRNPWYQESETYIYGGYYSPKNSSNTVFDPFRYVVFYY